MSAFDKLTEEEVGRVAELALSDLGEIAYTSYTGNLPIPGAWCIGPVVETRDSGLVDMANARALSAALKDTKYLVEGYDPDTGVGDYEYVNLPHWDQSWVEHLAYRVVNEDGSASAMLRFLYDWTENLKDCPIASDEILWELVAEATAEAVGWLLPSPQPEFDQDEAVSRVISWLHENGRDDVLCVNDNSVDVTEADVSVACLGSGMSPGDEHELELPVSELIKGLGMTAEQLGGAGEGDTVYLVWEDEVMAFRAYDVAGQPTAHLLSGVAVATLLEV
jgi:hypothetical protein